MLISVSGKGGLLTWLFLLWAGPLQSCFTASLSYKRPNITHWLSQSPREHSNLTISHFTSLHFTLMYLYITIQAQFSLLSGFLFPNMKTSLYNSTGSVFKIPAGFTTPLFWEASSEDCHCLVNNVYMFILISTSFGILSVTVPAIYMVPPQFLVLTRIDSQ